MGMAVRPGGVCMCVCLSSEAFSDMYQDAAGMDVTGQVHAVALNMYQHSAAASGHARMDQVSC